MSNEALRIVHIPHGHDHPYKRYEQERIPRYPAAGEPVTLRATVEGHPGAVTLQWWRNGLPQPDLPAVWQAPLWSQPGCWTVSVGPFAALEQISYRWSARGAGGAAESEPHAFDVLAWDGPAGVIEARAEGPELLIRLAARSGPLPAALRFAALRDGLVRISLTVGTEQGRSWSALTAGPALNTDTVWRQSEDGWEVVTAAGRVVVMAEPLGIRVWDAAGQELLREYRSDALRWLAGGHGAVHALEWAFHTPPGEQFWGGGERFDRLTRRGSAIDNIVFNQYRDQEDRTYLPVPFLISSRGYGLYADTARIGRLDVAASASDRLLLQFDGGDEPGANLDLYLLPGPGPTAVVEQFTALTGKPELPPRWAFGPWMSANSWDRQAVVEHEAGQTLDLDIPASVLVIEAWSDEITFCIFNDAQYEAVANGEPIGPGAFRYPAAGRWPDPKRMIDDLHRNGMRVVLWQIPVWKRDPSIPSQQKELDEAFLIEQGYVVRNADGTPYRVSDEWFAGSLLIDFTNPEAAAWWLNRRRYLLAEYGVDGLKTDGGEFIYPRDVRFHDGSRGHEGRNLYANRYIGAVYGLVREVRGSDGLTFSRAGYTGAGRMPMHWAGDERSTFAAFRASVVAGLNAGLAGVPFWGWDIGGFSGDIPSAELFCRATAMACFCPVMQYHSESKAVPSQERTPWNLAERTGRPEVLSIYRFYAHLRMNLLPYLYGQAAQSARTGVPLMRPLLLDYPNDQATWGMDHEYLLGEALLVAPVLEPDAASRRVYLPEGGWYDFWTGAHAEGPGWVDVAAPLDRIPVFVREGSALPLDQAMGQPLGAGMGNRAGSPQRRLVRLYPPQTASFRLTWTDGEAEAACPGRHEEEALVLDLPAAGSYEVVVPGRCLAIEARQAGPVVIRPE